MSSPLERRIEKYSSKLTSHSQSPISMARKSAMVAAYTDRTEAWVSREISTKAELDTIGIATIDYPAYLAFSAKLFRLVDVKKIAGESCALEASVLIDQFVARGLAKSTLEAIRTNVYSVGAPVAP
jgi:hypothetical protein